MAELKTLKDLHFGDGQLGEDIVHKNEIKAEVVKWIKEFQGLYYESMHGFIKTFFNLKEEDLEEKEEWDNRFNIGKENEE